MTQTDITRVMADPGVTRVMADPGVTRVMAEPGVTRVMAEPGVTRVMDALARHPRLRVFLRDRMIAAMPAKRSRRLLLLDEVAQAFEPGVRYPESEVNRLLEAMFSDYCALRRYLVDEDLLSRSEAQYWRSGGPVQPSAAHESA